MLKPSSPTFAKELAENDIQACGQFDLGPKDALVPILLTIENGTELPASMTIDAQTSDELAKEPASRAWLAHERKSIENSNGNGWFFDWYTDRDNTEQCGGSYQTDSPELQMNADVDAGDAIHNATEYLVLHGWYTVTHDDDNVTSAVALSIQGELLGSGSEIPLTKLNRRFLLSNGSAVPCDISTTC